MLFLSESTVQTVVTAATPHDNVFRRLSEPVEPVANVVPVVDLPRPVTLSQRASQPSTTELPASRIELTHSQPVLIVLNDILNEVTWVPADQMSIWRVEFRWKDTAPFRAAQVGGTIAYEMDDDGYHTVVWRSIRRSDEVQVDLAQDFIGQTVMGVSLQVLAQGEASTFTRRYDVVVRGERRLTSTDDTRVILAPTREEEHNERQVQSTQDQEKNLLARKLEPSRSSRRLSWDDSAANTTTDSTLIWSAQAPPLLFETTESENLTVRISGLLPWQGVEQNWCCTTIYLFTEDSALVWLTSAPADMAHLTRNSSQTTEHACNDAIVMHRVTKLQDTVLILLEVEVKASRSSSEVGLAVLPVEWGTVSSLVATPEAIIFVPGSLDVPTGGSISLNAFFAFALGSGSIEIQVEPCSNLQVSTLSPVTMPALMIDPDDCVVALPNALVARLLHDPLDLQISQVNPSAVTVPTKVTVSVDVSSSNGTSSGSRSEWTSSRVATASQDFRFCRRLAPVSSGALYFHEGEANALNLTHLLTTVTKPSGIEETSVDSISFVWSTVLANDVGAFIKDEIDLAPRDFNSTSQFVSLDWRAGSNFSYVPLIPSSYSLDVLVRWTDTTRNTSDCMFVDNVLVYVVPAAGSPTFATPFVFSPTLLRGSPAQITIPIVRTSDPARQEYLSLALSANTTEPLTVECAGTVQIADMMDGWHYLVIDWSEEMSQARQVVVLVTPPDSFSGTLVFDIEVSVVDTADASLGVAEFTTDYTVIQQVEVEWLQASAFADKPSYAGQAVYRSMPTPLNGDSVFSFSYRMRSGTGFNSLSRLGA